MGKFDKMKSAKVFDNVKKVEQEKAQVVVLQNILPENLVNNPKNGEDITVTDDLEYSMQANGFTDPLEVTDYGMEAGKYMIMSGHRRRAAAGKVFGPDFAIPCIVRHFDTAEDVQNYTLLANDQRDSAKDPLMWVNRVAMHQDYLESIGFKGSKREEVSRRTGLSLQAVDRYIAMGKVVLPVHDMVRQGIIGISSAIKLCAYSEDEQMKIYDIMQQALRKDVTLTRDVVSNIVKGYDDGKRTWAEIADLPRDSGMPLSGNGAPVGGSSGGYREPGTGNRNDEIRREYDPIAAEYDAMDAADRAARERLEAEAAAEADANDNAEDTTADEDVDTGKTGKSGRGEKRVLSQEEQRIKLAGEIVKQMCDLDTNLGKVWECSDAEQAATTLNAMVALSKSMAAEVYRLAGEWQMAQEAIDGLKDLVKDVEVAINGFKTE